METVKTEQRFMSAKNAGKLNDMPSEFFIRKMIHAGICPGFKSGTRFLIDVPALRRKLSEMSANGENLPGGLYNKGSVSHD